MNEESRYEPFPTTMWSVVEQAKGTDDSERLTTLNRLLTGYWRPVYCFIRKKGYRSDQAEDLTQEFFYRFFERDWISRAEAERGRFRTYLLAILVRFLADQGSKRLPRQKQFDGQMASISSLIQDRDRCCYDALDSLTPERAFMREWAKAVIENARCLLKTWCAETGRSQWYEMFCLAHCPDHDEVSLSQEAIASRLATTRDKVRYGSAEASRKFAELLRSEVAGQVESSLEIEQEIHELMALLEH